MKRNIVLCLTLTIAAALIAGCGRAPGKIRMQPVSHVGVGQKATLAAYEEKSSSSFFGFTASAAAKTVTRNKIDPAWTVSDPAVASVDAGGVLTGTKPGKVTVKGTFKGSEVTADVLVSDTLHSSYLPMLTANGAVTMPTAINLSMSKDRKLKFHADFDDPDQVVNVEQTAPDQKLPWSFDYPKGKVTLTAAAGHQITGEINPTAGGSLAFTVWSDDEGVYPIGLQGKTFIIIGDSMAEGLAWFLREKVEAAGGKFYSEPYYSSTTIKWQDEHRMTQMIAKYHPDIVWITLGSNEVIVPHVEGRASAVKQITEEIGDRPAYWIGPPSWRPDQGIVNVIQSNFRPGYFYNSNDLKVPRNRDGAHPTRDGFHTWAELLWTWYGNLG